MSYDKFLSAVDGFIYVRSPGCYVVSWSPAVYNHINTVHLTRGQRVTDLLWSNKTVKSQLTLKSTEQNLFQVKA